MLKSKAIVNKRDQGGCMRSDIRICSSYNSMRRHLKFTRNDTNHGFCGSTSCIIKVKAKGNFHPYISETPQTIFTNLRDFESSPLKRNLISIRRHGWSGRKASLSQCFFHCHFVVSSSQLPGAAKSNP